jgi:CRP-like cAMP-binding protein
MPRRLLKRYPLFALLGSNRLDAWLAVGQDVTAATGETLLQAGTEGVCVYLLLEGQVRVVRPSANSGEVSVGKLGPGDLFGEYALLPPGRNTATCRTAEPSRLLRLPLAAVAPYFAGHPQVWPNPRTGCGCTRCCTTCASGRSSASCPRRRGSRCSITSTP